MYLEVGRRGRGPRAAYSSGRCGRDAASGAGCHPGARRFAIGGGDQDRLAELLHAAISLLAEFSLTVSPAKEGVAMPLVNGDSAAISPRAGNLMGQPAHLAAILLPARSAQPAKIEDAPSALRDMPAHQCRPPFVGDYTATSVDWVAFKQRFLTTAGLTGWLETEALRALPAALGDALAEFLTIPPLERSILTQASNRLASVYEPPADTRHKVPKCVRAQQLLHQDRALVTCAMSHMVPGSLDGAEPLVAYASTQGGGDRGDGDARRTDERWRPRSSSRSRGGCVTCYQCGLPGHVASGCHDP
ncbi:unnamed protein product [Lampetra fluviatilis]